MQANWLSYHLFYHGDRNQVVLGFVTPTVSSLAQQGMIDSFFFIRYSLGGPHIRLRLRVLPGCTETVNAAVTRSALSFLDRSPSPHALSEDVIRRNNKPILAWNPAESADCVYPDNTFQAFPFVMETERYGGPALIGYSLDFFALSSVESIHFIAAHRDKSITKQLAFAFLALARQAWGAACDGQELSSLLGYSVGRWKDALKHAALRADEIFEDQRDALCQALQSEFEQMSDQIAPSPTASQRFALSEAARRLSWEIRATDTATRHRILKNQMHMTANRLGLTNPEETYLGRLLWRTVEGIAIGNPAAWRNLRSFLTARAATPPSGDGRLRDLLPQALAGLQPEHSGMPPTSLPEQSELGVRLQKRKLAENTHA